MDRVRLAIVGCGSISSLNSAGYLEHEACEVVALCDPDLERCRRRAREWGVEPKLYRSYEEVLADPDVDAVELLTPTHLHAAQSVAALEAGKHVSCQKPMAATVAEADEIAAAAARAGTVYRVTENFLYYPPIVKAKELLDHGRHRRAVAAADTDGPRLPDGGRPAPCGSSRTPTEVEAGRRGEPGRVAVRRRVAQVRHRNVVARGSRAGFRDG